MKNCRQTQRPVGPRPIAMNPNKNEYKREYKREPQMVPSPHEMAKKPRPSQGQAGSVSNSNRYSNQQPLRTSPAPRY